MKIVFWILIVCCLVASINALTGYNEYDFGTSGYSAEKASGLERALNAVFYPVFALGAYGIRKRKEYAWWIVTVLYFLAGLGFLSNRLAVEGKEISFVVWIIISQVGCASLVYYFRLKFWKPKRESFFREIGGSSGSAQKILK